MNKEKIEEIRKIIADLRVVNYNEENIETDTTFLGLKEGNYYLNNGNKMRRESVVRRSGCADAVAMFAITLEKEILLVIQPRAALPTDDKIDIELPAGYIEEGEEPSIAAMRELNEETGYVAQDITIIDSYYPSLGYSGEKIYIAIAIGCEKKGEQHLDKDEFVSYIKVTIKEFKYLLDNDYILDATARLAYYRTLEYLTNNQMLSMVGDNFEEKKEEIEKED